MTANNRPGKTYEAIVHARWILGAAHVVLGVIAAFSLWPMTGPPPIQHFHPYGRGGGWLMVVLSMLGWGPYLISWLYTRSLLDGNLRGVIAFCIGALGITTVGVGFDQHLFALRNEPPTILVSVGIAVSLLALAKVCSLVWRTGIAR
jgi:hypothetical protein